MAYAGGGEASSTQTPEERRVEARRILDMGLPDHLSEMKTNEMDFVSQMEERLDLERDCAFISPKQLWWLRDLKEKYL
jgi:hypothetical protein